MGTTLLTKLNKWAGTKGVDYLSEDTGLSACFKWLVPKLDHFKLYHRVAVDLSELVPMPDYAEAYTKVFPYDKTVTPAHWHFYEFKILVANDYYVGKAKTPTLALCLAIEKLIDGEKLATKAKDLRIQMEDPGPWGRG